MKITLIAGNERMVITDHPFKLLKNINLSGLSATINVAESGIDGSMFLNSRLNQRDFELEGMIDCYMKNEKWIQKQKELLYRVCNPKELVKIKIETGDEVYFLDAYPVSFPVFQNDFENSNKKFQTFLMQFTAPDPFLYRQKKIVTFSKVTPMFRFPMRFNSVTFGVKNDTLIQNIYNDGMLDCPVEITMEALQDVTNPYILNVHTQKKLALNTILKSGDKVVITTGRKKEVSRFRNGVKEYFYYALDLENDHFVQLKAKQDNIFRFGADVNEDSLRVQMAYTERLGGL